MLKVSYTKNPKDKPQDYTKGFGNIFTDHMFLMDYKTGKGWHDARIVPFDYVKFTPATMCFHYGQEIFEGMRVYRAENKRILMFRPMDHIQRFNNSSKRMCMPTIIEKDMLNFLIQLIKVDMDWLVDANVDSFYLRPIMIASESVFGARSSNEYLCMAVLTPGRPFIPKGPKPLKIFVEKEQVRAVKGGTGAAKCAGNYAATFMAQEKARMQGYDQVLWLDGLERKYAEEMGQMNIFFKIGDELITPALSDTILDGITRRSILTLANYMGVKTIQRQISIQEIMEANSNGILEEVFGCGTGACVAPVKELSYDGHSMKIGNGEIGKTTFQVFQSLTRIQRGNSPDLFGWTLDVKLG